MKKVLSIILSLCLIFFASRTNAQQNFTVLGGYSFSKYPAAVYKGVKAKLDFNNNPSAKAFRTVIKEGYKDGKIDFAGAYVSILFGCGTGCTSGYIVDARDGKIYGLPLSEQTSGPCWSTTGTAADEDRIVFKPTSRLFISSTCTEPEDAGEKHKIMKTYHISIWDEKLKKFINKKSVDTVK